jgi:outer membrane protein assembly factor BamA
MAWGLVGWWCLLLLVAALPAGAFTFTPYVDLRLGYDDNVRLKQQARGDAFVSLKPGLRLSWGRPSQQLNASASLEYTEYYRLSEYTGLQGGQVEVSYRRQFSPRWRVYAWERFSSSFDQEDVDEQGRLIRVRGDTGRRDRNTVGVRLRHDYGRARLVSLSYTHNYSSSTVESVEEVTVHQLDARWVHALGPDWQVSAEGFFYRDDYQKSPDLNRYGGEVSLARMFGPTRQALLTLGYQGTQADTDDPVVRQARDYEIYSASLGYSHKMSPTWGWRVAAGWSQVSGDSRGNQAAGQGYPTFQASLDFSGQRWEVSLYAKSDLGEYDLLGENSGLTLSHSVGARLNYELARHWSLALNAGWTRDNYKQAPTLAGTDENLQGDIDSYSLGGRLSWQVTRRAALSLDYRYLCRDAENDDDDRTQNRVLLILTVDKPYRW